MSRVRPVPGAARAVRAMSRARGRRARQLGGPRGRGAGDRAPGPRVVVEGLHVRGRRLQGQAVPRRLRPRHLPVRSAPGGARSRWGTRRTTSPPRTRSAFPASPLRSGGFPEKTLARADRRFRRPRSPLGRGTRPASAYETERALAGAPRRCSGSTVSCSVRRTRAALAEEWRSLSGLGPLRKTRGGYVLGGPELFVIVRKGRAASADTLEEVHLAVEDVAATRRKTAGGSARGELVVPPPRDLRARRSPVSAGSLPARGGGSDRRFEGLAASTRLRRTGGRSRTARRAARSTPSRRNSRCRTSCPPRATEASSH